MPASVKAWSVGAKTVNGPGPCKVSSRPAWTTALTSESWTPVHWAVRGMSLGVSVGMSTLSMTWMRPFDVMTSAMVTLASLTITPAPTVNESGWSLAAVALMHSVTFAAGTSALTTW